MLEKPKLGAEEKNETPSVDPIVFDDEVIFGLDPAVHWVNFNNQHEQFPEIVTQIIEHWDDLDWFEKLLGRLGYNAGRFDATRNPRGIFEHPPHQQRAKLTAIRVFSLRAAGVTAETIKHMFKFNFGRGTVWRYAKVAQDDVATRRRMLASGTP